MTFDPISHAAGIGAGQEAGQRRAHAAELEALEAMEAKNIAERSAEEYADTALILAVALNQERNNNAALQDEIKNKWIRYGVRLRASIMARQVEKEYLIAALKASDPSNAERMAQEAEQHSTTEYNRIANDPKSVGEVREVVLKEAGAGRLG
ncbi:hypothetical protein [Sideroxyarcus sp. TK5]